VNLPVASAPRGVLVLDRALRIVGVHASGRIGRLEHADAGRELRAADPRLYAAIAAAARRALDSGRAELGIEVGLQREPLSVSIFPAGDSAACVFADAAAPDPAAIVESAPDALVSLDTAGIVRGWNPGAERLYGYPAAEALGMPVAELELPHRRSRCDRLVHAVAAGEEPRQSESVRRRKDGARIAVWLTVAPVRDPAGHVVGVVEVGRDITAHRARERRTARALRESERRSREVVASMVHAEAIERSRIATELHDDTVQVMTASLMAMDRVALVASRTVSGQLESAVSMARATLEEATERTRRLMFELRPAVLLRDGLVAAVRVLAEQIGRETGARVHVRGSAGRYDSTLEELVYRSVQEALSNVRKHARAESISVAVVERRGTIRAEVCDDGLGFDVVDARSRPQAALHIGLDSMSDRIRAVGGTVTIESSPGAGTCVRLAVPVRDSRRTPAAGGSETLRVLDA
jgi:PAS domain S-box-containing protein